MPISRSKPVRTAGVSPIGVVPGSGFGAAARSFEQTANLAENMMNEALAIYQRQNELEGRQEGIVAGNQFDEFGAPVAPEVRSGLRAGDAAYMSSAMASYHANLGNHAKAMAENLSTQFNNDAVGFGNAFEGYMEETVKKVDPSLQPEVRGLLISVGAMEQARIMTTMARKADALAVKDMTENVENVEKQSYQFSMLDGAYGSPYQQQLMQIHSKTIDALVAKGEMTSAMGDRRKKRMADFSVAGKIIGDARRIANAALAGKGDMTAAYTMLEKLNDPAMDPDVSTRAGAEGRGEIQRAIHIRNISINNRRMLDGEIESQAYADLLDGNGWNSDKWRSSPASPELKARKIAELTAADQKRRDQAWSDREHEIESKFHLGIVDSAYILTGLKMGLFSPSSQPRFARMIAAKQKEVIAKVKSGKKEALFEAVDKLSMGNPEQFRAVIYGDEFRDVLKYNERKNLYNDYRKNYDEASENLRLTNNYYSGTGDFTQEQADQAKKLIVTQVNQQRYDKGESGFIDPFDFTEKDNDSTVIDFFHKTGRLPTSAKNGLDAAFFSGDDEDVMRAYNIFNKLTKTDTGAARLEADLGAGKFKLYSAVAEAVRNGPSEKPTKTRDIALNSMSDNKAPGRRLEQLYPDDAPPDIAAMADRVIARNHDLRASITGSVSRVARDQDFSWGVKNVLRGNAPRQYPPEMLRAIKNHLDYAARKGDINEKNREAYENRVVANALTAWSMNGETGEWERNSIFAQATRELKAAGIPPRDPKFVRELVHRDFIEKYNWLFDQSVSGNNLSNAMIKFESMDDGTTRAKIFWSDSSTPYVIDNHRFDWETSPDNPLYKETLDKIRNGWFSTMMLKLFGEDGPYTQDKFILKLEGMKRREDYMDTWNQINDFFVRYGMPARETPEFLLSDEQFTRTDSKIIDFFQQTLNNNIRFLLNILPLHPLSPQSEMHTRGVPLSEKIEADGK